MNSKNELLNCRMVTILKNSEITNSIFGLEKELNKIKDYKAYTYNELQNSDQSIKDIMTYEIGSIITLALKEWKSDYIYDYKDEYVCQLCGQKHIKYVYKITNTINNKTLNVGSECIRKYTEIQNVDRLSYDNFIVEGKRRQNKFNNINSIKSTVPNVYEIIEKFDQIKSDNTYVLPSEFDRLMNSINSLYKNGDIFNKKQNYDVLVSLIKDMELFNAKNEVYIREVEKNEYGLNKKVSRWIKSHITNISEINEIKNEGKVTINNISLIKEPVLNNKLVGKAYPLLNEIGIILYKVNGGGYNAKMKGNENYKFRINAHKIVDMSKKYIFMGEHVSLRFDKVINEFTPTYKTYEIMGNDLLNAIGFSIIEADYQTDTLAFSFQEKKNKINLQQIVDRFKNNIIKKDINKNEVIAYISKNRIIED